MRASSRPANKETFIMSTMQAVQITAYGGAENLALAEVPRPAAAVGEVLVKVAAASVNAIDWKLREGWMRQFMPLTLPVVPGVDFSGTVAETGPGVTGFAVGDAVFGTSANGTYAEYIAVPADAVARKPASVDHVQAAAVPLVAGTAFRSLFDSAEGDAGIDLQPGQTILIHGAAGGVGTVAVQLARNASARVIATGLADQADYVRGLGADDFIDTSAQRIPDAASGVDAVLDLVNGELVPDLLRTLKPGGIYMSTLAPAPEAALSGLDVVAKTVGRGTGRGRLEEFARLIDDGKLRVPVKHVFPLGEAAEAQTVLQSGRATGKVVLRIAA
jgi:NADPH:quinone reductase-like Zn-dependent oxidoreductase